jgi:nucleoside 2-deoxyribosyltransferase
MKKIYLANGLFSEADYLYNEKLADEIEALSYRVYAPQRNKSINDKSKSADSIDIFKADRKELDSSDILVAVLDGLVVDPGVAAEIGYMAAKGKRIIGLFTDGRENSKTANQSKISALSEPLESQFAYVNLFVVGAIKERGTICLSRKQLIDLLSDSI